MMDKQGRKLLTLTTLFTIATGIVHVANNFIVATSQLKDILDLGSHSYYHWRFGKIYYTKKGTGSPLLLIHDIVSGASGYEWHKIEKELSANHTVYTIDLLGCGRSEKPGVTYTNFLYVQLLSDFVKNIIGKKTDVIASGFSCSFVTTASNCEKNCFKKIIFVNPTSPTVLKQMPSDKNKLFKYILEIPVFGTLVYHMIVSRETISNTFIEKGFYNPFHVDDSMIDTYYEAAHKGGYFAKFNYACYAARYMNININHALSAINNCIYIIEGDSEPGCDSIISEYCKINPSIEAAKISGTKHFPHMEDSKKFVEQLDSFLE